MSGPINRAIALVVAGFLIIAIAYIAFLRTESVFSLVIAVAGFLVATWGFVRYSVIEQKVRNRYRAVAGEEVR